jgi:2,4-diaminopentanoate dehydrogenase
MTYRVVQWGTGNVGRHSLRGILERPELELAALRVYNKAKVGVDAGTMLGHTQVGIAATDDAKTILGAEADVVMYNALGTTLVSLDGPVEDIARLLETGKNVIASAVDLLLYVKPGVAPAHMTPAVIERLKTACEVGGSTFYCAGMTPGFALDLWPITMTRVSRRVDQLRVTEVVNLRDYQSSTMEFMGFGLRPDAPVGMYALFEDTENSPYAATLHLIADALGCALEEVTYERELATTPVDLDLPSGHYAAGTVVATKFHFIGISAGKPFVTIEYVWRVTDDVAPDWPTGHCTWILDIEGDPRIHTQMTLSTETDAKRPTSLTVAMHGLNAIPAVVAAAPGLANHLTLPVFGGRGPVSSGHS